MMISGLIDQKHALLETIKGIQEKIDELDHQIMSHLIESGDKQVLGSDGTGYALTSTTRYQYGPKVLQLIKAKGLLEYFQKPSITRSMLELMRKQDRLTYQDLAEIERWTIVEQSPYSLRRVVPKEAKVIA